MKAIILAAGLGLRLSPLTLECPKCLLELHRKPIIFYQLDYLRSCGVTDIAIVVGYQGEKIQHKVGGLASFHNYPYFEQTNNLYTLHHIRHLLDCDTVILFSDVLAVSTDIEQCISNDFDIALLVDTARVLEGTMRIKLHGRNIVDIGSHIAPKDGDGNFIGIAKLSAVGARLLCRELDLMVSEGGYEHDYYTKALPRLNDKGYLSMAVPVKSPWMEIDDLLGLEAARRVDFYRS